MKRIVYCLFILLFTVTMAGATEVEGRPGRYDMRYAEINTINGLCAAWYEVAVAGNSVISNAFSEDTTSYKVVVNKNNVQATCKFIDTSGVYEKNAEVGDILDATLITPDGTYIDGTGQVVAAANNKENPNVYGGGTGGNVTIHIWFNLK